ncbi:unnamed protein product [Calicophoron daubneyi]|uniref:Band 7 domain-containing protein n=1 Tax=Calicophoron daubneyi TaxID=300641 RepID=A0AAV2U261_CALDB
MGNIHTVGPSEALVISGGCCGTANVRTIIGGWGWAWCSFNFDNSNWISLGVMTLKPVCENVETSEGVPLTVTGVAQVKVIRDDALLRRACEQFLGKDPSEIRHTILQTMEGHLRAILGTLTVEAIYRSVENETGEHLGISRDQIDTPMILTRGFLTLPEDGHYV